MEETFFSSCRKTKEQAKEKKVQISFDPNTVHVIESAHDKTYNDVRPAKTQISLRIRAV